MVLQPTCSDVDYKLVWKTTQEYLAQKGINNILWLYAPAKPSEYELETRCTSFIRLQYFRIDFAVRTILFESMQDIEILPWFEWKTIFHQHARQKSWHKRSKTSSAKIAANADEKKWSSIQTMEEFVSYMIGAKISFC